MSKTILAILLFISLALLLAVLTFKESQPVVSVSPGVSVIHDTTIVRDTIRMDPVVVVKKIVRSRVDTLRIDDVVKQDTSICYDLHQDFLDGASIDGMLCSQYFPPETPPDLEKSIEYAPSPYSVKIIEKTDTLRMIQEALAPAIPLGKKLQYGVYGAIAITFLKFGYDFIKK
jgi:hypothetical protein